MSVWWFLLPLILINDYFGTVQTDNNTNNGFFGPNSTYPEEFTEISTEGNENKLWEIETKDDDDVNDVDVNIFSTEIPTERTYYTSEFMESVTENPCNGSREIQNVTAIEEQFRITLSWEPPENNCVSEYSIYLNNDLYKKQNKTKIIIYNLNSCQLYRIVVASHHQNSITSKSIDVITKIPEDFNYSVENLKMKLIKYDSILNITWNIEKKIENCVKSYEVYIVNEDNIVYNNTYVTEKYYEFKSIVSCMKYQIKVTPITITNKQWKTKTETYPVFKKLISPLNAVSVEPNKTSTIIKWTSESSYECISKITKIIVDCMALKEENEDKKWIKWKSFITFDAIHIRSWREFTTEIFDLSEFTNYTCFGTVKSSEVMSNRSQPVNFRTFGDVPSPPESVTITDTTSHSFKINWKVPGKIPGVLTGYNLYVKSVGPLHFVRAECDHKTDEYFKIMPHQTEFIFKNGYPNYNYSISINAEDSEGNGTYNTIDVLTNTSVPDQPENIQYELFADSGMVYNVTAEITWILPCNINGPLKAFVLNISNCYIEEEDDDQDCSGPTLYSLNKNNNITDIYYAFNLTDVKASSIFLITIQGILENDTEGQKGFINFTTPAGYPSSPTSLNITSINSTSFAIDWMEPSQKNGQIMSYNIAIEPQGPQYYVPSGCPMYPVKPLYYVTDGNTKSYLVSEGLPSYNYSIYLNASTSVGCGPASKRQFITQEDVPESVGHLKISENHSDGDTYNGTVTVEFSYPCKSNGIFQSIFINYDGIRTGYANHSNNRNITNQQLNYTYSFDVKPDYEYSLNVTFFTKELYKSSNITFHTKSGVPRIVNSSTSPKVDGTTKALFNLSKNNFDESNGDILYYSLIIAPPQNVQNTNYGFWNGMENTWPKLDQFNGKSFAPYEIKEKFWNPFQNNVRNYILIEIGSEEKCANVNFCNKPLIANTEYALIVRVLTNTTYRDSAPLNFETVSEDRLVSRIVIMVICVLVCSVVLNIFIFKVWKKQKRPQKEPFYNPELAPAAIQLEKFQLHYRHLKDNCYILKDQFILLDTKMKELDLPSTYAILPENKRKNRYSNILPYDETRVKLKIDEDDEIGSDYINASFIKGYSGNVEYIATQGPLESTCKDFWKMILQENVSIIVMVSQFIEQNKEKCFKYIPNNHENIKFGDNLEVRCSTELHFGNYCVRTLQVKKETVQRTVIHMQFLQWPDFGVPSGTENMLQFCQQIRERIRSEGGIITVHCSAGVGRTGTLITTDILLQTIEAYKDINIFKIVLDLRKQRINMVQTEKQYMYIHTCINDARDNPISAPLEKKTEPLYENLKPIRSSMEANLLVAEAESAL